MLESSWAAVEGFLRSANKWHLTGLVLVYVTYRVTYQLFLWPYLLSPLRKVPGPPLGNPLFGQFSKVIRAEAGILQREWAKEHGPIVRAVGPIGIERMMFLNHTALQKILVSDWTEYPRPDFMRWILGITAGFGLLTVTGDEHRLMRKALNPAFSIPNLTAQVDMYYEPIYGLVDILKAEIEAQADPSNGKVVLAYDWLSKVTLDIICLTAFGYKTDSLHNPDNELADAYHNLISLQNGVNLALFMGLMSVPGFLSFLKTKWVYNRRHWFKKISLLAPTAILLESMERIKGVSAEILREKVSDTAVGREDTASKRDIMSLLVQARMREKGEGYRISDEMMMEQVLTFLGAGHETTASGLAWTLWLLATHPEVQEKLRAEVAPLVKSNPNPDFRTLKLMEYLDAVVMESLRVLPPVPMTIRQAGKSDYVDGVWMPKGTLLYIPIRVVNTYKEIWGDDAEEFRPERWAQLPEAYSPSLSLLSFIAGPHHCIGRTMAIVEMKAVVAVLVANFEFEPAFVGQRIRPTAAVTMKPDDNLPLRIRPVRKAWTAARS